MFDLCRKRAEASPWGQQCGSDLTGLFSFALKQFVDLHDQLISLLNESTITGICYFDNFVIAGTKRN